MPRSGDHCTEAGTYVTCCPCEWQFWFEPPLYFTSCIHCGDSVEWRFLSPAKPPVNTTQ